MSAEADDLFARVLADPHDDGARLVYADALTEAGDSRGELIAAQLALAAGGIHRTADLVAADLPDSEILRCAELLRRVNQLLAQHADAWTRELFGKDAVAVSYRRGMPHEARVDDLMKPVDPAAFVRALHRTTVQSLYVKGASDDLLAALAREPPRHLRDLDLMEPRLTDPQLLGRVLANLPELETFAIWGREPCELDIDVLVPLQRLATLRLFSTGLDRASLDALARLPAAPSIRSLSIHNSTIGDDIVDVLDGRLPALTELALDLCRIGPTAFARGPLHIPRVLSLAASLEGRRSLAPLLAQPTIANLERLDLSSCFMHGAAIEEIARCDRLVDLRCLRIDNASISDQTMIALANSASARLTALHLSQTGITASGLAALLASDRHAFRVLDCWPSEYARDGRAVARALAEAPGASSLRDLRLHECELDDEDVVLLANSPHLASLRRLVMSGNRIGNTGARALARSSQRLVTLGLWNNHIGEAGQRAWLEAPVLVEIHTNAGRTSNHLENPQLVELLRARFGSGFTIGRDPVPRPSVLVVFPGTPPLTHAIVREVIAALPHLALLEGDEANTVVRDPRHPDAGAISIRFSHDWEDEDHPRARAGWVGIASIAYDIGDKHELVDTVDTIARALAVRTGGILFRDEPVERAASSDEE